jgi:hypothetical protein
MSHSAAQGQMDGTFIAMDLGVAMELGVARWT